MSHFPGAAGGAISKRVRRTGGPKKPTFRRLRLEPLENRWLLSVDLISAAYATASGGNASSTAASISNDGRYVAFSSDASDLVLGDTNGARDIFLRDATAGTTARVSTDSSGNQATGASGSPRLSGDAQFVAFVSSATNLVAGDINGVDDIFVKNVATGIVTLASADSSGNQANGSSLSPLITSDGRFVAFLSDATNLVPGDSNGARDVFVKDLSTGAIVRASTDSSGNQANAASTSMSTGSDGRFVAFASNATNLVAGDTNGLYDVFLKDLVTGTTIRVSTDNAGNQISSDSFSPRVSDNGRYVAFQNNGVVVKDLSAGALTRIAVPYKTYSYDLEGLTANGRYLTYASYSSGFRSGISVKDLQTGVTISPAAPANQPSLSDPSLTNDAQYMAYTGHTSSSFSDFTATNVYRGSLQFPPPAQSTIGVYAPSTSLFSLRNTNTTGVANEALLYGPAGGGWLPIAGDWDGNGTDTAGMYDPATSTFYLSNSDYYPNSPTVGTLSVRFPFGVPGAGWLPIAGQWSGHGPDTVGLYNPHTGTFYLSYSNTNPLADLTLGFGVINAGWLPVTGDWDGNGSTTVGLYAPDTSMFYLRNTNSTGVADLAFGFGQPGGGWKPIAGDWTGTGSETIGLYAPDSGAVFLRNSNSTGVADTAFGYGAPGAGWLPIVGAWIRSSQPLLAEGGGQQSGVSGQESVGGEQSLIPLVTEALSRWAAAGVTIAPPAEFVWADLPGAELGRAGGNKIYLDRTAASLMSGTLQTGLRRTAGK